MLALLFELAAFLQLFFFRLSIFRCLRNLWKGRHPTNACYRVDLDQPDATNLQAMLRSGRQLRASSSSTDPPLHGLPQLLREIVRRRLGETRSQAATQTHMVHSKRCCSDGSATSSEERPALTLKRVAVTPLW